MNVPETPGYARVSSACHATPYGTSTSFAPNARMRSSFAAGAVSIATTVHGTPAAGAAEFVGVDRLEVLELEPHVRESRPQLQADQRCANDRSGDARPGLADLA